MTTMMEKTATDLHWNGRAQSVANDAEVNIMDVFQRELEYDCICRYLDRSMRILEVGCGNGYSTERFRKLVEHVDAFDYAESMIERAKERVGEINNRFFHDNVLAPKHFSGPYDTVICVRVLINLRNLAQQKRAIENLVPALRPGGCFILAEGFREGFGALDDLRTTLGLPRIERAKINVYVSIDDLRPLIEKHFELEEEFHLGAYDYLTRIVYPMIAGPENVKHNTVFSEKCAALAGAFNPDCFAFLSRMRGLVLRKRD